MNQTLARCCRLHGHQSGCKHSPSQFKVHIAKAVLPDNLADTEKRGDSKARTWFPCRSLNMTAEIWDVVVIGAGLSGLSAAHLLRKRNARLKVLLLEGKGERLC